MSNANIQQRLEFGEAVKMNPTATEDCDNFLPDSFEREYSGPAEINGSTASTGTAEGDRKRRADANRKAREARASMGPSRKKAKAEASRHAAMTAHFREAVAIVVEAFKPDPMGVEALARSERAVTADSDCSKWTVIGVHLDCHAKCLGNIEKEESKGGKANPTRLLLLRRQRDGLVKKMEALLGNDV